MKDRFDHACHQVYQMATINTCACDVCVRMHKCMYSCHICSWLYNVQVEWGLTLTVE